MAACLTILGLTMLLRACFPSTIDAMRETVLPMMEDGMDYRSAITALGESLTGTGEVTFLEVLGDITIRAFLGSPAEDVEVTALPEEAPPTPTPPPEPEIVPGWMNPPIEEVIYLPDPRLWLAALPETPVIPETPEAVAAFFAHQEAFSGFTRPGNVYLGYSPLGIEFVAPLYGPVSSPFGFRNDPIRNEVWFHFGTDIAVYTGTPILAFAAGRVTAAREGDGWGKYILLDHGDGIITRYAHLNAWYVQEGDLVERGQMIARVGATGGATGPHLHFELNVHGMYRNPEFYIGAWR